MESPGVDEAIYQTFFAMRAMEPARERRGVGAVAAVDGCPGLLVGRDLRELRPISITCRRPHMVDLPDDWIECVVRFVCGAGIGFVLGFFCFAWMSAGSSLGEMFGIAGVVGLVCGVLATVMGDRFWNIFKFMRWVWWW